MADWPSVNSLQNPSYGLTEVFNRPQVTHEFEANYGASRPAFSRARKAFDLSWSLLPEAQFITLRTFVNSNMGNMFGWTHPVTTEVSTCRFGGMLESTIVQPGYRSAKIRIEEV